jgi:hypothetical protein
LRGAAALLLFFYYYCYWPLVAQADRPCRDTGVPRDTKGPCEGGELTITDVCHCQIDSRHENQPWGATAAFRLDVPQALVVKSGATVDLPVALHYTGETARQVDFPDGDIAFARSLWRGKKRIVSPPCTGIDVGPEPVRLSLEPGAVVRGSLTWKAWDTQLAYCEDMGKPLRRGRYRLVIESKSGTPPLTAEVTITVKERDD